WRPERRESVCYLVEHAGPTSSPRAFGRDDDAKAPMPEPFAHHPGPQGLYDPRHEHDACGVAMVATLTGEASHAIVEQGLTALRNLEHRGASGADPSTGDGAGVLLQVPDAFLRAVVEFPLPPKGEYVV